jgi:YihY family inner membrane protein
MNGLLQWLDRLQQRRSLLAFPFAVTKKFGDDNAGSLAALIAYYGFFSLFPLLLVFVTVMGFVFGSHPAFEQRVINSVLGQFPIIGDQLRQGLHSVRGSGFALVVGIVGSLWAGLGVTQAAQNAMNSVWTVPRRHRPGFVGAKVRGLMMLFLLGGGMVLTTAVSAVGTGGGGDHLPLKIMGLVVSAGLNVGLFWVGFRITTVHDVSWQELWPGAVLAGTAWQVLQALGTYYVGHQLKGASQVYGFFAIVIGLLSWLYLGAQITLYAAEVNVVRSRRLWPRSLTPPMTDADERTLTALAKTEERRTEEVVDVTFDDPASAGAGDGTAGGTDGSGSASGSGQASR